MNFTWKKMNHWKQLIPYLFTTLLPLGVLLYFRELYVQPSLLKEITVVVPFEDRREAVFGCLIFLVILVNILAILLRFSIRGKFLKGWYGGVIRALITAGVIVLNAIWSYFEIELINNYYLNSMETRYHYLGIGITLILYLVAVFVSDSLSIGMILGNIFFLLWGLVNYYVQAFRGIPFQWIDFGSIRTAMSVSGNYDYTPTWQMVSGIVITFLILVVYASYGVKRLLPTLKGQFAGLVVGLALLGSFVGVIFHTDFLSNQGIWLRNWQPWYTYRLFGMESGFLAFAKASFPEAPEGYSAQRVEEIIEASREKESETSGDVVPDNIIVIMNESFSDLTIYPNFKTNTDVMPFLNSMVGAENTQQGSLLVSVKGGLTANTEYEFLTGNSGVLSPSTVAYNSFIKDDQYSLARTLKDQGYTTLALHPYIGSGWNRNTIYPKMGFDAFYSLDNYYEDADTLRGFVSDEANTDTIIELMESKEEGEKLFFFNVTMQNHSGYTNQSFDSKISVLEYEGDKKENVEQYLTLLQYSDAALEKLVNYCQESDENTLILFFGDHQPEIGDDFWSFILERDMEDLSFEEQQLMYTTRYFIWANYDLPELEDQTLSANYLSSYLLSLTGLEMTDYNQYLLQQREVIPVMNAYGYIGNDYLAHQWHTDEVEEEAEDALGDYNTLIYNELTGGNSRDATFFGLNGE